MYFLKGTLPWQGLKASNKKDKYDKIKEQKINVSIEELCEKIPGIIHFILFGQMEERNLNFQYLKTFLIKLYFRGICIVFKILQIIKIRRPA